MIKFLVDRCHVSDSLQDVVRFVIDKFEHGFEAYRGCDLATKARIFKECKDVHDENREIYRYVTGGLK